MQDTRTKHKHKMQTHQEDVNDDGKVASRCSAVHQEAVLADDAHCHVLRI